MESPTVPETDEFTASTFAVAGVLFGSVSANNGHTEKNTTVKQQSRIRESLFIGPPLNNDYQKKPEIVALIIP
jgi:hypothetical protein